MARYRVGVTFGSRSTEHEVSVVTAMQVVSFIGNRHEVIPIYITKDGAWFTGAKLAKLGSFRTFSADDPDLETVVITPHTGLQTLLNPMPRGLFRKTRKLDLDVIFPVMHGVHGEDGTLQGLLELADIPYVGSGVLASSIGMDKIATKAVLKENGLPVLDYMWFTRAEWERDSLSVLARAQEKLHFPMIVKPADLGSSIGVSRADSIEHLTFGIDVAIHFSSRIIVELCVERKLEVNCAVLGNESPIPSVCEQVLSKGELLTYDDKYLHGKRDRGMQGADRIVPAPIGPELTEKAQQLAVKAFCCIGCSGIARVDLLLDQATDQIYVNELNTMPGSISHYLWEPSGISPEQLVDRLIELALEVHAEKHKTTYTVNTPLLQRMDLLSLKKG